MNKTHWNKPKKKNRLSKEDLKTYSERLATAFPKCQICLTRKSQDLHHLAYGSYGADKDDRSMIAVCRKCHEYCHKNKHETLEKYRFLAWSNWKKHGFK